MKKALKVFLLFFFIISSSCNNLTKDLKFTLLSHGRYNVAAISQKKNPYSPYGSSYRIQDYTLIEQTNNIPLQIGISFGIEYMAVSKKNISIPVVVETIYPKSIGPYKSSFSKIILKSYFSLSANV